MGINETPSISLHHAALKGFHSFCRKNRRRNPLSLIALLRSPTFFVALLQFDRDLAETAHGGVCPHCHDVLHRADYPRKPRGLPPSLGPEHATRFSFCCARDGCRRRTTPASVRFLGPRVFTAAMVLLVTALCHGLLPRRVRALCDLFSVNRRTLQRWRDFWQHQFPTTMPFALLRARVVSSLDPSMLPTCLLTLFAHVPLAERVQRILHRLGPLTTHCPGAESRFLMSF